MASQCMHTTTMYCVSELTNEDLKSGPNEFTLKCVLVNYMLLKATTKNGNNRNCQHIWQTMLQGQTDSLLNLYKCGAQITNNLLKNRICVYLLKVDLKVCFMEMTHLKHTLYCTFSKIISNSSHLQQICFLYFLCCKYVLVD